MKEYKLQGKTLKQTKPCFAYRKQAFEYLNRYQKFVRQHLSDSLDELKKSSVEVADFFKDLDIDKLNEANLTDRFLKLDKDTAVKIYHIFASLKSDSESAVTCWLLDVENIKQLFSVFIEPGWESLNFNPDTEQTIEEFESVSKEIFNDFFLRYQKLIPQLQL